jgi:hypothetical protein
MLRRNRFAVVVAVAGLLMTTGAVDAHEPSASGWEERTAQKLQGVIQAIAKREVEAVIATWYAELQKRGEGNPHRLLAPRAIVEDCECLPPDETPVKYAQPRFRNELAYEALKFSYEIVGMRIDRDFARVHVWERGWYYAWSAKETYENDADATFVLERQDDQWKILAFSAHGAAVHPKYANDPMPNLSDEFFRRFPDRK